MLESEQQFDAKKLLADLSATAERLRPYLANVSREVGDAIAQKSFVVFEGAQGSLLDVNHGTYPFVTSSNTLAGFACVSAGFGPTLVDSVLGICKAYSTRVGSGPFPTEDSGPDGETLRKIGHEFGTVTGRPRRCGWFDAMAVRRTIRLNGIDNLILTKLDVLSEFPRIKLGTRYTLDGEVLEDWPVSASDIERVTVDYEEVPGWQSDISKARSLADLPKEAQAFIRRVEELAGCRIGGFSVGPDRAQTIILCDELKGFARHTG